MIVEQQPSRARRRRARWRGRRLLLVAIIEVNRTDGIADIFHVHQKRDLGIGQEIEAIATSGRSFEMNQRRRVRDGVQLDEARVAHADVIFEMQRKSAADAGGKIEGENSAIGLEPSRNPLPVLQPPCRQLEDPRWLWDTQCSKESSQFQDRLRGRRILQPSTGQRPIRSGAQADLCPGRGLNIAGSVRQIDGSQIRIVGKAQVHLGRRPARHRHQLRRR